MPWSGVSSPRWAGARTTRPRPGRGGQDEISCRSATSACSPSERSPSAARTAGSGTPGGGGACAAAGRGAGRDPRTVSSRERDASPVGGARSPSDHDMWRLCAWAVPCPCDGALACEPPVARSCTSRAPTSPRPPARGRGALSWEQLWTHLLWRARPVLYGPGSACPGTMCDGRPRWSSSARRRCCGRHSGCCWERSHPDRLRRQGRPRPAGPEVRGGRPGVS